MNHPHVDYRSAGVTLLETVFALSVAVSSLLVLGAGVHTAKRVAEEMHTDLRVQGEAQGILDLILAQRNGSVDDTAPTADQLEELFDFDDDPGDVSVRQLTDAPCLCEGWQFTVANAELSGTWRVRVDADLDGDGVIGTSTLYESPTADDKRALETMETAGDVVAIRVYFDDELIIETFRNLQVKA